MHADHNPRPLASAPCFDVMVVGGGGAGLAAAIEAAVDGARVLLVEKNLSCGGSTAWSVGSISVNGSPHQRRLAIDDCPQAHFEDLGRLAGALSHRDNVMLRRLLVEHISETFDWLCAMGLVFTGPMPEPPHRVARMHNVLPNSGAFAKRLVLKARALAVEIRLKSRVTTLLRHSDGTFNAKLTLADQGTTEVSARTVVLAAGDYSANHQLLTELVSPAASGWTAVNASATGDGLELGRRIGAVVVNGDLVRGPVLRFVPPPTRPWIDRLPSHPLLAHGIRLAFEHLPRAIVRAFLMQFLTTALGLSSRLQDAGALMVNRRGERLEPSASGYAQAVAQDRDGEGYVVFDANIASQFEHWPNFISTAPGVAYAYLPDYLRSRRDVCHVAQDIERVANKAGVDGSALKRALYEHNQTMSTMNQPVAIDCPPYYVLGPVKAYIPFTEGGLAVNDRLQVLDADQRPIARLYAAGSNGQGGVLLEGHGHHLGWAFVSGRLAGRYASAEALRIKRSQSQVGEAPHATPRVAVD